MNKLVLLSSMVMVGAGVVRGGEYHEHGGNLERERIEPLVADTTGDRDITGDEVGEIDEVDIDGVVERGVGDHVLEMQGVVARQAHRIGRLEELIESYERLSRKTCKVLQGLGSTEGGIAREETLVTLAGDLPTKKSIDGMHRNVRKLMWWVEEGDDSIRSRLSALESAIAKVPTTGGDSEPNADILAVMAPHYRGIRVGQIAWHCIESLNADMSATRCLYTAISMMLLSIPGGVGDDLPEDLIDMGARNTEYNAGIAIHIEYERLPNGSMKFMHEWLLHRAMEPVMYHCLVDEGGKAAGLTWNSAMGGYTTYEWERTEKIGGPETRDWATIEAFVPASEEAENFVTQAADGDHHEQIHEQGTALFGSKEERRTHASRYIRLQLPRQRAGDH
ncbi:MAG: hypothetical protein LBR78_00790 [Holosporales bacterium]|jgi:hypothetical protein|nr:hypothetical protein [Holosporales bacterium]